MKRIKSRNHRINTEAGLTLVELAVIIVVLGLLLVLLIELIPKRTERMRLNTTRDVTLERVKRALVEFAAVNGRLPCADTSTPANGLEGGGATSGCAPAPADGVGRVPYRTLGFSDPILDDSHIPVRYGVYRNPGAGSADADLAVLRNRFIPVLPGDPATVDFPVVDNGSSDPTLESEDPNIVSEGLNPVRKRPDNQNDLDFCLALRNAKAAGLGTGFVHTLDLGGRPPLNAAFVLVSGGVEDADGDGLDLSFDGVNEGAAGVDFESPARRRNDSSDPARVYDDLVVAMPFHILESKLSCAAITVGANAAANVANAAALIVTQGEDTVWVAERNTVMDDTALAIASLSLALAILGTLTSATDLAVAVATGFCPPTLDNAAAVGPIGVAIGINVGTIALSAFAISVAVDQGQLNDATLTQTLKDALAQNDTAERVCTDAVNADQRGGQGNAPPPPPSPSSRP